MSRIFLSMHSAPAVSAQPPSRVLHVSAPSRDPFFGPTHDCSSGVDLLLVHAKARRREGRVAVHQPSGELAVRGGESERTQPGLFMIANVQVNRTKERPNNRHESFAS